MAKIVYGNWQRGPVCKDCRVVHHHCVVCPTCSKILRQTTYRFIYEKKQWLWIIPYDNLIDIQIKG